MDAMAVKQQIEGLITRQNNILESLGKFRKQYAEARISYETQQTAMTTLHREKTMKLALDPSISEATDPRSGRANKEWSQYLIDAELESDQDYIKQFARVWDAQQDMFNAEADQLILAEELGVTKVQSRMLSSLLDYASGELP